MRPKEIAPELVKAIIEKLSYDADTGVITWTGNSRKSGKIAGHVASNGYRFIVVSSKGKRKNVGAHRIAWFLHYGGWPLEYLDHIDGNPDNNSISNLRECTHAENMANIKKHAEGRHGFKGIYQNKGSKRFYAQIRHKEKKLYLGAFDTEKEASDAYMKAAEELRGQYARRA